jgi:hypothetical protein
LSSKLIYPHFAKEPVAFYAATGALQAVQIIVQIDHRLDPVRRDNAHSPAQNRSLGME